MTAQRKRRVRPLPKPTHQPGRRKRSRKEKVDWKGGLVNFTIAIVFLLILVMIFFMIRQCGTSPIQEEIIPEPPRQLQIEVLNGCGVSGIAAKFTDYLRSRGFDVIRTENYETFNVLETVVIDRQGNQANMQRIGKALGLTDSRLLQEVNEAYLIDATVIIGQDYRHLDCWKYIGRE